MRLNSKVTWGLAWAGLAVVVAVSSMDFLTGKLGDGNKAALITSTTDPVTTGSAPAAAPAPVKTAGVTTTLTKTGVIITPAGSAQPADPVNKYLSTNKALPDYISGGSQPAASDTTQVANVDPVAPIPFPARPAGLDKPEVMAPAASVTATPAATVTTAPVVTPTDPIVTGSTPQQVVILDQPRTATIDPTAPRPPADIVDDSANWKARGLEQYLDQNGLLDKGKSTATVTGTQRPSADYDPDGFYLSDGPNDSRAARRARVEQLFDEAPDAPPPSFSLF